MRPPKDTVFATFRLNPVCGDLSMRVCESSVATLSVLLQKWQSIVWTAKMTEIQCEQNRVGLAQVGRISAVFPNLRSIESCASWQILGTFLRKLGREAQKTGV